jgi:imidazolonepropionase-like amidohydrolase
VRRLATFALFAIALASSRAAVAQDGPGAVAITHARVHVPGGRAPLEDATVVLAKGKVQAVGAGLAPPVEARVIDAHGKTVTPGLIDANSAVGVVDVEGEASTNDADVHGLMTPALRMVDGYNPRSALIPIAREGGVTSVVVAPRSGVLGGQAAFVDLAGETLAEAVVRPALAQYAHIDEETAEASAGTRSGLWLLLREALEDTRFYAAHRAQYDANGTRPLTLRQASLDALLPVLRGQQPIVVSAHRASDIEAALRLTDELGLKLILQGASEAWMIADDLARRRVPVVIDPMENLPERFDRLHARSDNAALLAQAGVPVIIATFSAHRSRLLWQHAGNAVRLGMDHDAAVRAITEAPAAAFGLKGYGIIEPGAVANVVVWSGDPLQTSTRVEHVFVRGREQSLETRQTLLFERYRTLPVPRDGSR